MQVRGNQLADDAGELVEFQRSPNRRGTVDPQYLILHYTAGVTLEGATSWFMKPEAQAAAHLVIGRNGRIVQMVRFDQRAWHAGVSEWGTLKGMNAFSLGIELVNAGKLKRSEGGTWTNWAGVTIPPDEVVQLQHKAEDAVAGWQIYPEAQIATLIRVAAALQAQYGLKEILGHEDIAPGRKVDPGPAFPMAAVVGRVVGRR